MKVLQQAQVVSVALLILMASNLKAVGTREINVNSTTVKPGQTLRLEMPKHFRTAPTVTWKNNNHVFHETWDHQWRALIPIPLDIASGEAELFIDPRAPSNPELYEGSLLIKIEPSSAIKETITVSGPKAALLGNSDEEKESAVIREFLTAAASDETQYWRGLFMAPVPGVVLSPFGIGRARTGQANFSDFHRGEDLSAHKGDPVKAANDGVVLLAKEFNFHGKTVLLSHGQGVCSIYLHLDEIDITEGAKIQRGQKIGRVGSTGFSTGPHLHWGVYVNAQPVDPEQWLKQNF